jgi:hypothetical protein
MVFYKLNLALEMYYVGHRYSRPRRIKNEVTIWSCPQVTIYFALMLTALGRTAHFPLTVMTYSLPVPVFGETSAVEGVLTAARHTAAGDLGGMLRQNSK